MGRSAPCSEYAFRTYKLAAPGTWLWAACLLFLALGIRIALLPIQSTDYTLFVHRWLEYIEQHGRHRALAYGFSNYEPAYTYLLVAASYFRPALPSLLLVKSICLPFELLAAWAGMDVAGRIQDLNALRRPGCAAFIAILLLPTLVLNNAAWGQCDIIYTAFLVLSFRSSIIGRPCATILWFGTVAFKFQALFFTPFIILLLLKRRISAKHLLLLPAVPTLFAIPAVLEGRPPLEIARILLNQADTYRHLAMNVANPWEFVGNHFYALGVIAAYLATISVILIYLLKACRQKSNTARWLLLSATVSLALMPFFLPKMHDRYFFPAELFCVVLACAIPEFRVPAVLMQLASVLVYSNFLLNLDRRPKLHAAVLVLAIFANTCALIFLSRSYLHDSYESRSEVKDELPTEERSGRQPIQQSFPERFPNLYAPRRL